MGLVVGSPAGELEAPPSGLSSTVSFPRLPHTPAKAGLQTTSPRLGGGRTLYRPLVSTHPPDFSRVPEGPVRGSAGGASRL